MHFPSSTFEEGANAEDVIDRVNTSEFDIVICDLSLPGRSGLDVVKQLKEIRPRLPVLILTMQPEEHYAIRALKAGAWGYLNKSDGAEVLIPAIQRVLQGRKYISEHQAEQLAANLGEKNEGTTQPHNGLSAREFDVFKLIVEGRSVSDISQQLSLSPSTISTHRARILAKMNMRSNADLVKYAFQNKLV